MAGSELAGSTGVWIEAVPICELAGQATAFLVPLPSWASLQKCRSGAEEGLSPSPRGSETLAVFSVDEFCGCRPCGTLRSTVTPEGESVVGDSEVLATVGANGTDWQPLLLAGGRFVV